jgi:uncharacterized membrane protein YedE/YeeE
MKSALISFVSGLVFAVGLGISGMTQPAKVIGFLDFVGHWDPSLAFVMVGAIGVHSIFYWLFRKSNTSGFTSKVSLPSRTEIDRRLIGGAVIFGSGWGLAGYCPGPALTSLASGQPSVVLFTSAMIAGIVVFDLSRALSAHRVVAHDASLEIPEDS